MDEPRPILPSSKSTAKWQAKQIARGLCAECAQPIDKKVSKRLCSVHLEAHADFARQYRARMRGEHAIQVEAWRKRQSRRQVARSAYAFPGSETIDTSGPLPEPTVHQPAPLGRAAHYRQESSRGPTYVISAAERAAGVLDWPRQTQQEPPGDPKRSRRPTTTRKPETAPALQGKKPGAMVRGKPRRV